VENSEKLSLEQIRAWLQASQAVWFEATRREEVYGWVTRTLCYQEYWNQKRSAQGLLRQHLARMTGLSRAQVTRLIARYQKDGRKGAHLSAQLVPAPLHGGRHGVAGCDG